VSARPYVVLSCAMSVDGYLDDATPDRLMLSGPADFDRVDAVRADCDAVLVGANTIRRDDPRLLVRSSARQQARIAAGRPVQPVKVTLTRDGDLPVSAQFFTTGTGLKLVFAATAVAEALAARLGSVATVIDAGPTVRPAVVLAELATRGVRKLLIEGGGAVHTAFLTAGLADELHLVVAPFFVGDPAAPRFVRPGRYRWDAAHRMKLVEVRQLYDVVLLRYLLGGPDEG
jgi:5-amino-6-(5-phosphoribosylamino)uracil reductase